MSSTAYLSPPLKRVRYLDSDSSFDAFHHRSMAGPSHSRQHDHSSFVRAPTKVHYSTSSSMQTPTKQRASNSSKSREETPSKGAQTPSRREAEQAAARELEQQREASRQRVLNVWENLAARYARALDEDDIVDLETLEVIKEGPDGGTLRGIREVPFGSLVAPNKDKGEYDGSEEEEGSENASDQEDNGEEGSDEDELADWDNERFSAQLEVTPKKATPSKSRSDISTRKQMSSPTKSIIRSNPSPTKPQQSTQKASKRRPTSPPPTQSDPDSRSSSSEEEEGVHSANESASSFRPTPTTGRATSSRSGSEEEQQESEEEVARMIKKKVILRAARSSSRSRSRSTERNTTRNTEDRRSPTRETEDYSLSNVVTAQDEDEESEDELATPAPPDLRRSGSFVPYFREVKSLPIRRQNNPFLSQAPQSSSRLPEEEDSGSSSDDLAHSDGQREMESNYIRAYTAEPELSPSMRRSMSPVKSTNRYSSVTPSKSAFRFSSTLPSKPNLSTSKTIPPPPLFPVSERRRNNGNPQLNTPPHSKSSAVSSTPDDVFRSPSLPASATKGKQRENSVVRGASVAGPSKNLPGFLGKRKRSPSPVASPTPRRYQSASMQRFESLGRHDDDAASRNESPDPIESVFDEDEAPRSHSVFRFDEEVPSHWRDGQPKFNYDDDWRRNDHPGERQRDDWREDSIQPADLSQLFFHLRKVHEWAKSHNVENLLDPSPSEYPLDQYPPSASQSEFESSGWSKPPSSALSRQSSLTQIESYGHGIPSHLVPQSRPKTQPKPSPPRKHSTLPSLPSLPTRHTPSKYSTPTKHQHSSSSFSLPLSVSSSVRSVRSSSTAMGPPPTPTRLFQASTPSPLKHSMTARDYVSTKGTRREESPIRYASATRNEGSSSGLRKAEDRSSTYRDNSRAREWVHGINSPARVSSVTKNRKGSERW